MSKLNGMQIFELLSNVNDSLIEESVAPALLEGGAAATAVTLSEITGGASSGTVGTAASAAAKTGFGAWVAKGGWVALLAGALAAAGIAVGVTLWRGDQDPTSPVTDTTASESESMPEGMNGSLPEDTDTEESTAETPAEPAALPLRLTDFSAVDLSLFRTEQGKVSVSEAGKLVVSADWSYGADALSRITWEPHALMPYAPAYAESRSYTPGALLMKLKREGTENSDFTFLFRSEGDAEAEAGYVSPIVYFHEASGYEYVLLRTDRVASYVDGSQPAMTMDWLWLGNNASVSDGRSLTVEEMILYPTSDDAMAAFSDYLAENGITSEILYQNAGEEYCAVEVNPQYTNVILRVPSHAPDGRPVKVILHNAYQNNTFLAALSVDEGVEYIRNDAFSGCSNLTVAYLPDSLIHLGEGAFAMCTSMTEVHLGSGLRVIERGALPIAHAAFTDIYYNGTMADWHRIARKDPTADHPIAVHCTDGTVDFSDPAPADLPREEDSRDLTALLANAPLMATQEMETLVSCEARVIRLKQGAYGEYKEFVLRWGLFEREGIYRYGFDILSMEDGSILAAPDVQPGMYRANGAGGMLYFEAAPSGLYDAMIFLYDYGLNSNGDLAYRTLYYGIACSEDGHVTLKPNYHLSPGLTVDDYLAKGYKKASLMQKIRVLTTLQDDLNGEHFGAEGYYLMSTSPEGNTTVFTAQNAPLFDRELITAVTELTLGDVLESGLSAFYERYAPRKRS